MADKVIHEVRFIETDDGFRIEVKGDKERIRKMGFGRKMRHFRHARRAWKHGCGPGFAPPWMWGGWEEDFNDEEETSEEA